MTFEEPVMTPNEDGRAHVEERYEKAFPVSWDQFHRDARDSSRTDQRSDPGSRRPRIPAQAR
jgi:hypothetical protein